MCVWGGDLQFNAGPERLSEQIRLLDEGITHWFANGLLGESDLAKFDRAVRQTNHTIDYTVATPFGDMLLVCPPVSLGRYVSFHF